MNAVSDSINNADGYVRMSCSRLGDTGAGVALGVGCGVCVGVKDTGNQPLVFPPLAVVAGAGVRVGV